MEHVWNRYWQVVQRKLPGILLASVAAALIVWGVVARVGPTYEVYFSYLISLSEPERAPEYRFDGYYALSATDLFAETLAQWLKVPENIVAAYGQGGLPVPSDDARVLQRAVTAQKQSAQLVAVTVRSAEEDHARRLAAGLREVGRLRVEEYHQQGIPTLRFRVVATEPWVGRRELSRPVIVVATFIFVFLLAVNVVILRESWRDV